MFNAKVLCFLLSPLLVLSKPNAEVLQEFKGGNRIFTANLYQEALKLETGNFIFSPFSVENILALAQSAGKDETALEIQKALHLPLDEEEIENDFQSLATFFKTPQNYSIATANKMYIAEGLQIKKEFQTLAEQVYRAGAENVNFLAPLEAANTINEWVSENTNNKIKDLVDPSDLDENTVAILVNAIHFGGTWNQMFNLSPKPFFNGPDSEIEVDTIHSTEFEGMYYHNKELNAQFLELPFVGDGASLILVLPDTTDGLKALEDQIDTVFESSLDSLTLNFVNVSIPKFTIESKSQMKEMLQDLGMQVPFDPYEADFSRALGKKGDVYITDVVQKAFISLDENGVEADAATSIGVGTSVVPAITATFIADHPFLFYIKVDDVIIFAGRVLSL